MKVACLLLNHFWLKITFELQVNHIISRLKSTADANRSGSILSANGLSWDPLVTNKQLSVFIACIRSLQTSTNNLFLLYL